MIGSWANTADGAMAGDFITFRKDGTFEGDAGSGTFSVAAYLPAMNLYYDRPPYQLTLRCADGRALVFGLSFQENGFSLTYWEGGGGYTRTDSAPEGNDHG